MLVKDVRDDLLRPEETLLLAVERGALLLRPQIPDREADVPELHGELSFRASNPRARTVRSLDVEALVRAARISTGPDGTVGLDPAGRTLARPVRLILTDRRLLAVGSDDDIVEWSWDGVTAVVHSASEPCSILREPNLEDLAVLVPVAEADQFRVLLDAGLDRSGATTATPSADPVVDAPEKRSIRPSPGGSDRVFRAGARLGGLSVLAIMGLVGMFLLVRALSALRATGLSFLTTAEWEPDSRRFGIAAVLSGSVSIALVAVTVAVPLAVGTALFISEVAPRRLKQTFIAMVDLMAAVPSIVYGLWGLFFLQGKVIGLSRWISTWFSWLPIFGVEGADPRNPLATQSVYTSSTFIAGIVVSLMVVPISCSIMREVFSQAPAGEREAAYALGATRWGMIRSVVLPFGKGGMIGAVMLGMGRALGETIAVYLIISPVFTINWHILQSGSNSVSALIALRYGDASGFGLSALMAAGLALFTLTLIVNFSAAAIVSRSRSGAESEG